MLAGLAAAEEHGIVHRDLKPENLLVTAEGRVKIADFGIAKATKDAADGREPHPAGTTVGTPNYIAPEQAMGQVVGPWTDLYSVGVIAFELFVGRTPFGDTPDPMGVLLRQVNEAIPPVTLLVPGVDPGLADWVDWLVSKDPSERPQSAAEAWDALEERLIEVAGPRWRREALLLDPAPNGRCSRSDRSRRRPSTHRVGRSRGPRSTPSPRRWRRRRDGGSATAAAGSPGARGPARGAAYPFFLARGCCVRRRRVRPRSRGARWAGRHRARGADAGEGDAAGRAHPASGDRVRAGELLRHRGGEPRGRDELLDASCASAPRRGGADPRPGVPPSRRCRDARRRRTARRGPRRGDPHAKRGGPGARRGGPDAAAAGASPSRGAAGARAPATRGAADSGEDDDSVSDDPSDEEPEN